MLEMVAEINRIKRDIERLSVWESGAGGGVTSVTAGLGITATTVGSVVTVKVASGTSFPGSPAAGDLFWRSDRNIEYVYDGTRWLSTEIFMPSVQYDPAAPRPGLAAGMPYSPYFLVSCYHPLYGVYVEDITIPTYHLTTLNSSNFASWNVRDDNGGGTTVSMSGWSVGRVANTTYYLNGSINTYYAAGVSYFIDLVKTGTPGNVYTYPPTLHYRLVG